MTEGDAQLELVEAVSATPPLTRLVVKVHPIVNMHHKFYYLYQYQGHSVLGTKEYNTVQN